MSRNSSRRKTTVDPVPQQEALPPAKEASPPPQTLSYVTPTEFVELPSSGRYYAADHPLHNQDTVELRFMTAKDEDILTSRALLRKGIAIDRLLENLLLNKQIRVNELLLGDKNAIILAARISGYGSEYVTKITCPNCSNASESNFDLDQVNTIDDNLPEDITLTDDGTFLCTLPKTKFEVEFRLLTGADENYLAQAAQKRAKLKLPDSTATELVKRLLVSVSGVTDSLEIDNFVDNMPALDARYIRNCLQDVTPNVDLTQPYSCSSCGYQAELEVPFTTDFFWPN